MRLPNKRDMQQQQLYRLGVAAVQHYRRPPAPAMDMPRLLILGVDGTLRQCRDPRQPYPLGRFDWQLMPHVAAILDCYPLRILKQGGMSLGVICNEAAVACGQLSADAGEQLLWQVLYAALGLRPSELFFRLAQDRTPGPPLTLLSCASALPQHRMRLPNPGMLHVLLERHDVAPHEALLVGSQPDEASAAHGAGVPFLGAWDFFGWPDPPRPLLHAHRCGVCGRFLTLTCQCLDRVAQALCESCERES
jgi:hypothetical protein